MLHDEIEAIDEANRRTEVRFRDLGYCPEEVDEREWIKIRNEILEEMEGGDMNLHASIKKVSTTNKDEGIDAQVILEFLVTPQTMAALLEFLELQGQAVIIKAEPVQTEMFNKE